VPSRRLAELRCPQLPTSSTSPGPALRAFSPCGNPQSRLRCLAAASIRSPPGLPSSRSSLSMPWRRLHAPCRSWPCRRPCRVIAAVDLQRSVTELGLPLSRLPTCSRFCDLPPIPSCPGICGEIRHSASTELPRLPPFPPCGPLRPPTNNNPRTFKEHLRRLASKMGHRAQACSPSKV
jgi:hypothetical protein